jgi:hypothetical protein
MSQLPLARASAPQTGAQVLEQEIIGTLPQGVSVAAGLNSTGFVSFQCNFKGSLRGVTLIFGTIEAAGTIEVANLELRKGVSVLPASPAESQVVAQSGVATIMGFNLASNPIINNFSPLDFSNAYQQGDFPIDPGDVLFAKWLRFVAGAASIFCSVVWRYGRNPRRMF